jgi:iron(II)-dependent oxidoreductase
MGTDAGDDDERPPQEICFTKPFWIDKFEVSNGQFDERSGRAAKPSRWPEADLPRVNITWFEARLFCTLRGARLPTEAEWEYAAKGPQNRIFAWGDTFEPSRVTYSANASAKTAPVDSRPDGASWVGALNMSGNVREWVSSEYQTYPYTADAERENVRNRATRGGSWLDTSYNQRTSDRFYNFPDTSNTYTGFRCAADDLR